MSSSHIYAAQADKAVVHVYSRARNNLEAVVPFPERIHSIALSNASEGIAVLILGTEGGRLILWEVMNLLVSLIGYDTDQSILRSALGAQYLPLPPIYSQSPRLLATPMQTSCSPALEIQMFMYGRWQKTYHSTPQI